MSAAQFEQIETGIERGAAAILGSAVGFALYLCLGSSLGQPQLAAAAVAAALITYALSGRALALLPSRRSAFRLPIFDLRELDPFTPDELVLSMSDRLERDEFVPTDCAELAHDELVLTDSDRLDPGELLLTSSERLEPGLPTGDAQSLLREALGEPGPDSRVVRLFDRKAMPTPGQLKSRIDEHLREGGSPATPSDASKALSEALAQLRRSLR